VLVKDERCGDLFEALVGTLRAAKKRKVIAFEGEMLLQGAHATQRSAARCTRAVGCACVAADALRCAGAHDHVDVVLLKDSYP
jgi:hypothetical protein